MSAVSRSDGSGGKAYVPRDRNSFRMSFCVVPRSSRGFARWRSATATYSASSHAAVALMVIEVFIFASGMPSKSASMSAMWLIGTPTLPTSPAAIGSSESKPVCVGRSKATLNPVWPLPRFVRKRAFAARGSVCPA